MSFRDDVRQFSVAVEARNRAVFANIASAVQSSITDGSPITGSPGQPVDTGALKASWQLAFDGPESATISTNLVYAPVIEDGIGKYGPLTLRSQVGGFHSVALTLAGFDQLAASVTEGS